MNHAAGSSPYNYTHFIGDDDFAAFRSGPQVGTKAPDGNVIDAATGDSVPLSSFWQGQDLLIEFGSLT